MNLLFDFDGVICDSFDTIVAIAKKRFPEYTKTSLSPQQARNLGLRELIKRSKIPKRVIPQIIISGRREFSKYKYL